MTVGSSGHCRRRHHHSSSRLGWQQPWLVAVAVVKSAVVESMARGKGAKGCCGHLVGLAGGAVQCVEARVPPHSLRTDHWPLQHAVPRFPHGYAAARRVGRGLEAVRCLAHGRPAAAAAGGQLRGCPRPRGGEPPQDIAAAAARRSARPDRDYRRGEARIARGHAHAQGRGLWSGMLGVAPTALGPRGRLVRRQ